MKRYLKDIVGLLMLVAVITAFYGKTLTAGAVPAPTDALVGLYHPWRDVFADRYPRGVPYRNFLITDPVRQQIPWRREVVDAWQSGRLPGWDPTAFTGTSLAFNVQSGAFYPGNIVFFLLPFADAWTLLIVSQTLGMAVFMYLYLRGTGLRTFPSVIGSLMAAFSGFAVSWLTWGTIVATAMWIPLSLWCIDRLAGSRSGRILPTAVLVLSWVCMATAGHTQIALYGGLLGAAYAAYRFVSARNAGAWIRTAVAAAVAGLILVPFLRGYAGVVSESVRGLAGAAWKEPGFFLPPVHLIQFLAPDFFGNPATLNYWGTWNYGELVGYVGVAGLIMAFLGAVSRWRDGKFWIAVAVVCLVFLTDNPLARLPYELGIPVVSSLQPTRLLVLVTLALSVLATAGFEEFAEGRIGRKRWIAVGASVCLAYALVIAAVKLNPFGITPENALVAWRNIMLPGMMAVISVGLLVAIVATRASRLRPVKVVSELALIGMLAFDLVRFGVKFTPFTPREYFFPPTKTVDYLRSLPEPSRVMVLDDRIGASNTLAYYGIQTVGGYDPVYSEKLARFLDAVDGKPVTNPPAFMRIVAPKNWSAPLSRYLGAGYLLSIEPVTGPGVTEIMREGSTVLYGNAAALPRTYLADEVGFAAGDGETVTLMGSITGVRPAVTAEKTAAASTPLAAGESAAFLSYRPGDVRIRTVSDVPRLLVFGESMAAGWSATVDGRSVPIVGTNFLFMGITVPVGTHTVGFTYRPI